MAAWGAPFDKGPYLQKPLPNGITVCWVSDQETRGTVRYRPAPAQKGEPAAELTAREAAPARFHRVKIAGLQPHTRYLYSVMAGGQRQDGSFMTAAAPEQPFRFVAYGDTRTQPDQHAAVLARIAAFQPDFILQTGDLVQDGTNETQWDEFFRMAGKVLRDTPYYPVLGNHERNGAPYFRYFDVAREYSFDYGNAHFTMLDSNRPPAEHAEQEAWLRKDLAAHRDATWRIVAFHHTPYTCVAMEKRRTAAAALRARLEPIFLAGKVGLVINGHDHDYQHHFANGIHYVVTGGGGAPLYAVQLDTTFTKAAKKAHHDCEITVDGRRISVRAVEPNGSVIEAFEIDARARGGPGSSRAPGCEEAIPCLPRQRSGTTAFLR
jgi:hypothetical protein